jgi:hypothetical protein
MNENELTSFYKRQVILSSMEAKQGKVPRIVGVRYQNDETGEYLVSGLDGKGGKISSDEYEKLCSENRIIFGHRIISG